MQTYRLEAKMAAMQALARQICAATRLQASYRGHVTYAQFKLHWAMMRRRRQAATTIVSCFKMLYCKRQFQQLQREAAVERAMELARLERLQREEAERLFMLNCHVTLQVWVKYRLWKKRRVRLLCPEWIARKQRICTRKRLRIARLACHVGGHLMTVTVFRSHIDQAKNSKMHVELYQASDSRTFSYDVHESTVQGIWAALVDHHKWVLDIAFVQQVLQMAQPTLLPRPWTCCGIAFASDCHDVMTCRQRVAHVVECARNDFPFLPMLIKHVATYGSISMPPATHFAPKHLEAGNFAISYDRAAGHLWYQSRTTNHCFKSAPLGHILRVTYPPPSDTWLPQNDSQGRVYYFNPSRGLSSWFNLETVTRLPRRKTVLTECNHQTVARGLPRAEAKRLLALLGPRRLQDGERVAWNLSTNMNSKRRVATAMPQEKPQQQRVLERQARDQRLERLNVVPSGHTTPWNSNTNVQSTRAARPLGSE
ncbi:hypothetical protein DYB37_000999 [Aphanomyces astaci]|uniref:WW domain-containing protein n=1 Tax=Aphanomyces astaci TaxID=112090 RepID=A0A418FCQ8_APHAT|nr:hypothetical protein DYB37_000999 [Aphanomyces astaci]